MGRLFIFALVVLGLGVAMSGSRVTEPRVVRAVAVASEPQAMPTVAYRPGEPMLVPGQVTTLSRAANGHFGTSVTVNGQAVEMVVDTGATVVALSVDDARRVGLVVDPAGFRVVGSGASGPVRGQAVVLDEVAVEGRHVAQVDAVVLDGLDRSLLGQSYLRRLEQVRIDGDTMTLR